MGIQNRIRNKLEQLEFAVYCFKRGNNTRFVRSVKALEQNNNLVYVENPVNGKSEDSREKPDSGKKPDMIYFIDMEEAHSGFFAEHNKLLSLLYFADYHGLTPVVRFHPGYCYAESHAVNGTENPFEYYFEQPCGIGTEALGTYQCVLRSRKENGYLAAKLNEGAAGYTRSDLYINEMARITSKYIRLNSIVRTQMQQEISALTGSGGEKILAAHVRGTDFKKNYNGHPIYIPAKEYLEAVQEVCQKGGYEKVFIATDDAEALALFKEKFGDRLLYYHDVTRGEGDTVMNSRDTRENHKYLLGIEVLRDMYTLAACKGLVAGLSQVSFAARIQKKSMGEEYQDLVILNHGINYHKKENCPH